MKSIKQSIRRNISETPVLPIFIIFLVASFIFVPNFSSAYNLKNYLLQVADVIIIACGLTFVVLNGGTDFSATATLTLGSVTGAYIMALSPIASKPMLSIPLAILTMLMIGILIGLINGVAVAFFRIPSFIATMATNLIFSGIAVLFTITLTGKASIGGINPSFFVFGGSGKYFIVPLLIVGIVWTVCYILLMRTKFGRELFAIGTNNVASQVSGINVNKTTIYIMILSGVFAAIQAIILTARMEAGVASLGDKMYLQIITCVIVGGTSTAGGFGGFKQTLVGTLFVVLIGNTMNLLQMEWNYIMVIQGVLVIVATVFGQKLNQTRKVR